MAAHRYTAVQTMQVLVLEKEKGLVHMSGLPLTTTTNLR